MRVAIITPYYREPLETLQACHDSVRSQTHRSEHFMVADGFARAELSQWPIQHIDLAKSHEDSGNTPRTIGSLSAMNQGFDAIAYLDADNWFYANHIEAMVKLHEKTGAAICTASRTIHRLDRSLMNEDSECDGRNYVNASCFFITASAFRLLPVWAMMPKQLGPAADRIVWDAIRKLGLSTAHRALPTVAFRTKYEVHYRAIGETPPPGCKTVEESTAKAFQWWTSQPHEVQAEWLRRMGLSR